MGYEVRAGRSTASAPAAWWRWGSLSPHWGLFFVLLAVGVIGSSSGASDDTPRWVGVCDGLVFLFGGAAFIFGFAVAGGAGSDGDLPPGTPWGIRLTRYLLGLGIVGAMAAIASWVAFGSGRRTFTATIPFLGRRLASEVVGRAAFGFGALLMYVFLAVFVVVSVRRLGRRHATWARRQTENGRSAIPRAIKKGTSSSPRRARAPCSASPWPASLPAWTKLGWNSRQIGYSK
jgi:hypothetical protein